MLIDSHFHLEGNKEKDLATIKRAYENGVTKLIAIGTDLKDAELVIKASNEVESLYGVIGIYPNSERGEDIDSVLKDLEKVLEQGKNIVGIGEIGIDITNWENQRPIQEQKELFEKQIQMAIKYNLPIVIHNRNGDEIVIETLTKYKGTVRIIAHCFDTSWETAKKLLDLGAYISFSGFITYNSKKYLLETLEKTPLDRILVETDSPYIVPKGVKEKPNEPKNVKMVAEKIAQVKNRDFEEICQQTYQNTIRAFNIN